jgi:primosomal protein N' (replication factor Y)
MNATSENRILRVALPVPLPNLFDYLHPPELPEIRRGTRVVVPFGKRRLVGVVCGAVQESRIAPARMLPVRRVLDDGEALLGDELMDLLEWCARYYKHAPGEVVFSALPPPLRRAAGGLPAARDHYRLTDAGRQRLGEGLGRAPRQHELLRLLESGPAAERALREWHGAWRQVLARVVAAGWVAAEPEQAPRPHPVAGPKLKAEQRRALEGISADFDRFRCHLLDGITGSGKTEVYLQLISRVLERGRQVLVLVPEIGLTPQLLRRFSERLGLAPAVYHSGLSDGERLGAWADARSGQARLILGTRSALFMPLPEAGLIIMDESHDASFKQQDGFRFAARDVAVKRAANLGVPVVLGTATPSLETVHNARQGRYAWHRLRERATGAKTPRWRVQDLRQLPAPGGLAGPVIEAMEETLAAGQQVLVFLNRRGYAPVLLCHECGWHACCHRCDANLTWHRSARTLVCHHCGHRQKVPDVCPDCAADALQGAGEGTQQLQQFLARQFPGLPLYRFDRDEIRRKGMFEKMYDEVRAGEPCILVGTQMLAKGHHFPAVTLVVVVNVDQALYSGDFRALERMGQLLIQVAGRAGREDRPGSVILQTHHPDHPLLETLITQGFEPFAEALLEERGLSALPPFTCQAALRAEATQREPVQTFLEDALARFDAAGVQAYGPYPALMERKGGRLRWYLLLQSESRPRLQAALDAWLPQVRSLPAARRVRWALDVDPQEF